MEIKVEGLSKRYATHWVFRRLYFTIASGTHFAVKGPNGSGKSTLLKILSGALPASEGMIRYQQGTVMIPADAVYRELTFAAPYADLIEEVTLAEAWKFHHRFRAFLPVAGTPGDFVSALQYPYDVHVQIRMMSSGMKQRLRLAFAMFAKSALLLLDEPTSSVDTETEERLRKALAEVIKGRTVIVVAHRLWTVRSAGKILVLQDGRIVETGTHGELLARGGVYAGINKTQLQTTGGFREGGK